MFHRRVLFPLSLAMAIVGCSAEVTPLSPVDSPDSGTAAPKPDAPATPPKDAGVGADTGSPVAPKLTIASAEYSLTAAGATSSAFDVTIDLENVSASAVRSIDEMKFDFGGGKSVELNQPVCQGSFPIAAGATKRIAVRIVVPASGNVSPANFSIQCAASQSFGAGDGTAPTGLSFAAPITLNIGGKLESQTFTASGLVQRAN